MPQYPNNPGREFLIGTKTAKCPACECEVFLILPAGKVTYRLRGDKLTFDSKALPYPSFLCATPACKFRPLTAQDIIDAEKASGNGDAVVES